MLRVSRKNTPAPEQAFTVATPPDAERALADLAVERAAALASIATLARRRADMLSEGASDEALETIDLEAARLRRRVERLDASAPRLREALAAEKMAAKEAAFVEAFAIYTAAQDAFLEDLKALTAQRDELEAAARAVHELGPADYAVFPRRDLNFFEPQIAEPYRERVGAAREGEARRARGEW